MFEAAQYLVVEHPAGTPEDLIMMNVGGAVSGGWRCLALCRQVRGPWRVVMREW